MRTAIVDTATGALERIGVSAADFDMTGKTLIEDVPDDLTGLRWDAVTATFVADIEGLRLARWAEVKALRDAHENGGTVTPLGRVDTDPLSIARITAAVVLAQVAIATGSAYAQDWTMEDNSVETHDAAAMIAMGVAVGTHVAAVHAAARVLRDAIYDPEATAEEIAAIDIDAGWPA